MIRKRWRLFAWSLLSAALLVLACWPLIIWWHVSNGVPLMPAAFETLLWPLAALGLGLAARGVWAACRPAVTSSGPAARPAARTIRRTPDPQRLLRRSGAGAGASLGAPFRIAPQCFCILSPRTCELEHQSTLLEIIRLCSRGDAFLSMIFIHLSQSWHGKPSTA